MRNGIAPLVACLAVPVAGLLSFDCPTHCLCYIWKGLVRTDCIRRNLFNTFLVFPHQTQVVDLSYNDISIIHGNEFLDANLKHLIDIRLSNNGLQQIDKLSFNGLQFLQNLDLSHNSIEYLNPSTFKHNTHLRVLNVSFNPLSLKKDEPFLSYGQSLQILDMANCFLEIVTPRSFLPLKRLTFLNLTRNNIRKIELQFLEGMQTLKYLDVSKNALPCNNMTHAFIRWLADHKIQFRSFCENNLKIQTIEAGENNLVAVELRGGDYNHNMTAKYPRDIKNTFNDIGQFFQSISFFYAAAGGIQAGILIGSFVTYFCMRKTIRKRKTDTELKETGAERTSRIFNSNSENPNFELIPLNTPPGTPPSPYRSRFFPSDFSSSAA